MWKIIAFWSSILLGCVRVHLTTPILALPNSMMCYLTRMNMDWTWPSKLRPYSYLFRSWKSSISSLYTWSPKSFSNILLLLDDQGCIGIIGYNLTKNLHILNIEPWTHFRHFNEHFLALVFLIRRGITRVGYKGWST